jgi:tetratricopeptide (TPR) repeat protein
MSEPIPESQAMETNDPPQTPLPEALDDLLALGQRYLDERNFVEAQQVFERALLFDPAHVTARHNLGYALECCGDIDQALAAYETVLNSPTPLAQSAFNRAVLLARTGRDDEARQAFERTLELDPTFATAWVNLGVLQARTGQVEPARQCYEQALLADPSCHSARLKLANLLVRESRWEEALAAYASLLEVGWNLAEVQYRRGLALGAQGNEDEAIEAYDNALEADPEHVLARLQLALLYAQRERYDRAAETLQHAADVAPDDARVQYTLGNMQARQAIEAGELVNYGYADAAVRAYRRAIERDPQFLKAYYNLACVAEKLSVPEGIAAWEQYLQAAGNLPSEQEWLLKARRYLRSLKDAEVVP